MVETAALAVFARRGTDLTMDDVAAEARLSRGTVYATYPTREKMVEGLVVSELDGATAAYEQACQAADPWEALREVLIMPRVAVMVRAQVVDPKTSSRRIRSALKRTESALENLLEKLREQGRVRPDVTAWHLRILFRGIYTVVSDYPTSRKVRRGQVEILTSIILSGIQPE